MKKKEKVKIKTEMDKDDKTILFVFCAFSCTLILMKSMAILNGKVADVPIALFFIGLLLMTQAIAFDDEDDLRFLSGEKERPKPTKDVKIKRSIFLILEAILWSLMLANSLLNTSNFHLVISALLMIIIGFCDCKYTNFMEEKVNHFNESSEAWFCIFVIPFSCFTCLILLVINIILAIVSFLC